MSALSTDNDISEAVVISSALESEAGSKYRKQESSFFLGPDLSPRVRPGTSVSVELLARHEPSVGDLVMEDRGQGHSGLPGMAPVLSLQPRVAQARAQLPSPPAIIPPPPPLLKIPSVDQPSSIPSSSSGKNPLQDKNFDDETR